MTLALCAVLAALPAAPAPPPAPDIPFMQESHRRYPLQSDEANDVRAVAVHPDGTVWAATRAGVFALTAGGAAWQQRMDASDAGPAFAVAVDGRGEVWAGAWNGLYRGTRSLRRVPGIDAPVALVVADGAAMIALGPDGRWRVRGDGVEALTLPSARSLHAAMPDGTGGLWIGTESGLYHVIDGGTRWLHSEKDLVSASVRGLAAGPGGTLWVGCLGGVSVLRNGAPAGRFTPREGLPSVQVRCVRRAPDGAMWVGTDLGAARRDGERWAVRHSARWLVRDDVRDIAFGPDGAAWIATGAGVSRIGAVPMTLAEKAERYRAACMARHVRPPGLVEKCRLRVPGDLATWAPRDDDNDGQYTSMYLAMQSYRYAATRDPEARDAARNAFRALRFLQTVTGTPSFVARTVIPSDWTEMADANRTFTAREWAVEHIGDPRYKRVERRWRPSADGKWLWKGDTSSDEITGHFHGYATFYDLAADESDRREVREHVRKVMDGIIADGYVLKDIDGAATRWAVWAPEKINQDPNWVAERGTNSVEILSFLKTTYHMTGDARYQERYLDLLRRHGYAANVARPKTLNPAWRTHIDDELLALAFPSLLLYEDDPALRRLYRRGLDQWYAAVRGDRGPYFNYLYGMLTGANPDPEASLFSLRDAPLDLIRWTVDNTRRDDVRLAHTPELEELETSRLLPPSERGVLRWDRNPWAAVQGDGGATESDGVYWLLPYWMGRHAGFLAPPR
ncbi:MAG: regulator [Chthonomonadales bacterium]|nr:regulator [Chthonomonadales bacterium]